MKRLLVAGVALVFMAGCVSNANVVGKASFMTFVYKPNAPVVGGPKLPVKVAVLPFKDGTEDFTKRGSVFDAENLVFNLAKSGIDGIINPLTPNLWAKAFADDMAASGVFRAVRFFYSPSELVDEEFAIEGTVEKAYAAGGWTKPSVYAVGFRAVRRSDNRLAWEKEVTRELKARKSDFDGCGTKMQCMADRSHEAMNLVMQNMFAEAREDFMTSLGSPPGGRAGEDGLPRAASPTSPAPESTEETIERILKAK